MANAHGNHLDGQVRRTTQWPIGNGALTDVFGGEWTPPNSSYPPIPVAIKIFRGVHTDGTLMQTIQRRVIRESRVWSALRHPNILPYFGYCTHPDVSPSTALISPFCHQGTILDYLSESRNPNANRYKFILDIASGLSYLHSGNVVHGDLHGKNVLIDNSGRACLSDFGRARVIGHQGYSTTLVAGCAEYMAPELLLHDESENEDDDNTVARGPPFSKMSDVYAFSMLMFQIFTGRSPLQKGSRPPAHQPSLITRICGGERPNRGYDYNGRISNAAWSLMEVCWVADPTRRPPSSYVLERLRVSH